MEKIVVFVRPHTNWAGQKYLLFSTHDNGRLAEVDFCHDRAKKKDFFRVFGYTTDVWEIRKSRTGAVSLAKRQVKDFFDGIGDKREIVFV